MIIRSLKTIRQRPGDGICGTNYANELLEGLNGLQTFARQESTTGFVIGEIIRVVVTDPASGGGKYNGVTRNIPQMALTETGDLSDAEMGPVDMLCLIFNMAEIGNTGHDLTDTSQEITDFFGKIIGYTGDNPALPVVAIWGIDTKNCG